MTLDGACGDEQDLRDFAVRQAGPGEIVDAALARGQRLESSQQNATWASTGCTQLGVRVRGERSGTHAVRDVQGVAKQSACRDTLIAPAQKRSEVGKCSSAFEDGIAVIECVDRFLQQGDTAIATYGEPGRARCDTERARGAEGTRCFQFGFGQPDGFLVVAEREVRMGCLRAPREIAGALNACAGEKHSNGNEVGQALCRSTLFEAKPSPREPQHGSGDGFALGFAVERRRQLVCALEAPLIDLRLEENAAVERTVDRRRGKLRGGKRGASVCLSAEEIAAA